MFESWGVVPNVGQELGAVMAVKITKIKKTFKSYKTIPVITKF